MMVDWNGVQVGGGLVGEAGGGGLIESLEILLLPPSLAELPPVPKPVQSGLQQATTRRGCLSIDPQPLPLLLLLLLLLLLASLEQACSAARAAEARTKESEWGGGSVALCEGLRVGGSDLEGKTGDGILRRRRGRGRGGWVSTPSSPATSLSPSLSLSISLLSSS